LGGFFFGCAECKPKKNRPGGRQFGFNLVYGWDSGTAIKL